MTSEATKPIGDITRLPMDLDRAGVPRGEVHVIAERCKECSYCIVYCPTKVLEYSEEINARGYHYPIIAEGKESACVLCKFCDLICPEFAIFTTGGDTATEGT